MSRACDKSENRNYALDLLRGFMVLYVLVFHVINSYFVYNPTDKLTYGSVYAWMSFFMVPFYFISGYFSRDNCELNVTLRKKIKALVLPYAIFTIFGIFLFECHYIVSTGRFSKAFFTFYKPTGAFLVNTPCWFFVSLFAISISYAAISAIGRKLRCVNITLGISVACAYLIAQYTCNKEQVFSIGNIATGYVIFAIGMVFRKGEKLFAPIYTGVLAAIVVIAIGFLCPQNSLFVLNYVGRGCWLLTTIYGVAATILLYLLFSLPFFSLQPFKAISVIGTHSIVLFAAHSPIAREFVRPLIGVFGTISSTGMILLEISLVLICCLLITPLYNRFVHFINEKAWL